MKLGKKLILINGLLFALAAHATPLKLYDLNAGNYTDVPNWYNGRLVDTALDIKNSGAKIITLQEIRYDQSVAAPQKRRAQLNMAEEILSELQNRKSPAYDPSFKNAVILYDISTLYQSNKYEGLATIVKSDPNLVVLSHEAHSISPVNVSPNPCAGDSGNSRIVQTTEFSYEGKKFYVFHTHFSFDDNCKAYNAAQAISYIDNVQAGSEGKLPAFLMGDLNATPAGGVRPNETMFDTIRNDTVNHWQDVWVLLHPNQGSNLNCTNVVAGETMPCTFAAGSPSRRIDYYWVNDLLQNGSGTYVSNIDLTANTPDSKGVYPSDHYGLVLTIDLNTVP